MAAAEQERQQQKPAGEQQQQQQQQLPGQDPQAKKGVSLQDLYLQVRDKPCRVADVRVETVAPEVEGAPPLEPKPLRLKQEILDRELDRVYEAKTLREVHEALERSVEVLRQLEAFDDITALIDSEPKDDPDACSVHLMLQEVGRYRFGGGTYTQGGEYSVEGNVVARNIWGVADQWALTGEIGTRSSKNFAASFRLPRAGGSSLTPELRLYQAFNNQQLHSSWTEALRGISLGLVSADNPGMSVGYEYGWRSMSAGAQASRPVRTQAGDYLKAALRCSCSFEGGGRTTGEVLSTEGWQLRLTSEVGGVAPGTGNLRYVRQQAHASWAAVLGEGVSFHIEAATGLLVPCWNSSSPHSGSKASPLPERFYLGGVESNLRGFETRGVGPSEGRRHSTRTSAGGAGGNSGGGAGSSAGAGAEGLAGDGAAGFTRDALGGDLFANVYAALMLRLPGKAGDIGIHGHVFANGGSSVLLSCGGGEVSGGAGCQGLSGMLGVLGGQIRSGAQQLGQTFRWSTGVGLVFPTQLGRLEANYCWVLTSQEHDRVKRGFSFGFAANMGL